MWLFGETLTSIFSLEFAVSIRRNARGRSLELRTRIRNDCDRSSEERAEVPPWGSRARSLPIRENAGHVRSAIRAGMEVRLC